ncbi:MAG: Tfp pilus assembly protein FimT/FimU [Dissulfurispiraceae bacterium]
MAKPTVPLNRACRFSVRYRSGFTFFELVVVLFILSLMLALALPSLSVLVEGRLKSDAKRIASILRYVNDSAMTTKNTIPIKVNLDQKTLTFDGPDGEKGERFDTIVKIDLQSRGTLSQGEVVLLFSPTGAQENIDFYLKGDGKAMIRVSFNYLSGRVKITDEPSGAD